MSMDREFPVNLSRDFYNKRVAPLIADGTLRESDTGWGFTYLSDAATGLNAGYVVPDEKYWRACFQPWFLNSNNLQEVCK